ncbi:MAG: PPC domain-containing protein, partial [Planctomycetota bacterium]
LTLGEALGDGVGDAQSRFYRLELPSSAHLVLTLQNGHGRSRHALYIQRDVLPTPDYYMAVSAGDAPEQLIEIPHLEPGPYYVMVRGSYTWWSGGYSILAIDLDHSPGEPEVALWVSTYRGATGAQVTVRLWAVGLAENARVLLARDDGTTIEAGVTPELEGYLAARFDLAGAALGEYDLVAINPDGREFAAPEPFVVEAEANVELWVDIVGRHRIRAGREQTHWVRFGSTGNTDIRDIGVFVTIRQAHVGNVPLSFPEETFGGRVDWSSIPIAVDIGSGSCIPLYAARIPPGAPYTVPVTILPHDGATEIEIRVVASHFGEDQLAQAIDGGLTASSRMNTNAPEEDAREWLRQNREEVAREGFRLCRDQVRDSLLTTAMTLIALGACGLAGGPVGWGVCYFAVGATLAGGFVSQAALDAEVNAIVQKRSLLEVDFSIDPNDKAGPSGFGTAGFIPSRQEMMYVIYFENIETATAPAQEVVITDKLDLTTLDREMLELGQVVFGNTIIDVPPRLTTYSTTIDLRPDQNLILSVEADLDQSSGQITWAFTSLDPETGELTEDPLAGFLPPNHEPPEGEGYVMFTVRQKPGLPSGTQIRNKASIVFDVNPPIETPEWVNTIDAGAPSSEVWALDDLQAEAGFIVSWSGEDDTGGSGVRDYTIYVSTDEGPYEVWLDSTTEMSATFGGENERAYMFYSRATDNVGHVEPAPVGPDALTIIALEGSAPGVDDPEGPGPGDSGDGEPEAPLGAQGSQSSGRGGAGGLCGIGTLSAAIMSLCVLGFGHWRRRCRH